MGVSINYVPRVTDYAHGMRILQKTEPIRGSTTYPLGRRRDHSMYSIRINAAKDIELVCYRTPVVTFKEDGTVLVQPGGWNSVTTRQFIYRTLNIPTHSKSPYIVLQIEGAKYPIRSRDVLTLRRQSTDGWFGKWEVLNPIERTSYRVNRKASNDVRARYKEFANYFKAMIALRTELVSFSTHEEPEPTVLLSCEELGDVYGVKHSTYPVRCYLLPTRGQKIRYLPTTRANDVVEVEGVGALMCENGRAVNKLAIGELNAMMLSGNSQEFYKAFVRLCAPELNRVCKYAEGTTLVALPRRIKYNFTDFIMRLHADEVIERFPTPQGTVPSEKYKHWVD